MNRGHRVEQQIETLVRLERAGVQHQRDRRREAERRTHRRRLRRRSPARLPSRARFR